MFSLSYKWMLAGAHACSGMLLAAVSCMVVPTSASAADPGSVLAMRAAQALESAGVGGMAPTHSKDEQRSKWTWIERKIRDETYPLTVDIVGSAEIPATKVMYVLAGGSTNFQGSFFTPVERNLVHFLCEHGYLVVGVTPREDNVPGQQPDMRFMASWGLEKHSADVRSIVSRLQPVLSLPYEVLGHSYGAITALDYTARYNGELAPTRVIALDIYMLDPQAEPKLLEDAKRTYDAHVQLLERGTYVDSGYALLKPAKDFALATPNVTSGTSRSDWGHSGTFTFEQLLFAMIIDSSRSAGVHTDITQLPGDWLFKGGAVAGRYKFADDSRNDRYAFSLTRYDTFLETVDVVGSGLIAVALERDVWAINANAPGYQLDWSAIKQPVVWINSEFGYNKHRYGAALIRAAGNTHVLDDEVSGYGHGDLLWAQTARVDLWERLLP